MRRMFSSSSATANVLESIGTAPDASHIPSKETGGADRSRPRRSLSISDLYSERPPPSDCLPCYDGPMALSARSVTEAELRSAELLFGELDLPEQALERIAELSGRP